MPVTTPNTSAATPAALGYRMHAEWEPQLATWFTWPRPEGISFPGKYDTVPPVYAELIRHLVQVEAVHINVWHADMEAWVEKVIAARHAGTEIPPPPTPPKAV